MQRLSHRIARLSTATARPLFATALALTALIATALPAAASPGGLPGGVPGGPPDGSPRPVVSVAQGALRGRAHDGAQEFLGVPYAAAPVGENRLRAPQPPPRWNGVREAVEQAPPASSSRRSGCATPRPSARTACTWTCTGPAGPARGPGCR